MTSLLRLTPQLSRRALAFGARRERTMPLTGCYATVRLLQHRKLLSNRTRAGRPLPKYLRAVGAIR